MQVFADVLVGDARSPGRRRRSLPVRGNRVVFDVEVSSGVGDVGFSSNDLSVLTDFSAMEEVNDVLTFDRERQSMHLETIIRGTWLADCTFPKRFIPISKL